MTHRLSPAEEALADADADITELKRRINTIITAWEVTGPYPPDHYAAQDFLRRNWPTLANAIDHLCVLDSLDKANGETTTQKADQ